MNKLLLIPAAYGTESKLRTDENHWNKCYGRTLKCCSDKDDSIVETKHKPRHWVEAQKMCAEQDRRVCTPAQSDDDNAWNEEDCHYMPDRLVVNEPNICVGRLFSKDDKRHAYGCCDTDGIIKDAVTNDVFYNEAEAACQKDGWRLCSKGDYFHERYRDENKREFKTPDDLPDIDWEKFWKAKIWTSTRCGCEYDTPVSQHYLVKTVHKSADTDLNEKTCKAKCQHDLKCETWLFDAKEGKCALFNMMGKFIVDQARVRYEFCPGFSFGKIEHHRVVVEEDGTKTCAKPEEKAAYGCCNATEYDSKSVQLMKNDDRFGFLYTIIGKTYPVMLLNGHAPEKADGGPVTFEEAEKQCMSKMKLHENKEWTNGGRWVCFAWDMTYFVEADLARGIEDGNDKVKKNEVQSWKKQRRWTSEACNPEIPETFGTTTNTTTNEPHVFGGRDWMLSVTFLIR